MENLQKILLSLVPGLLLLQTLCFSGLVYASDFSEASGTATLIGQGYDIGQGSSKSLTRTAGVVNLGDQGSSATPPGRNHLARRVLSVLCPFACARGEKRAASGEGVDSVDEQDVNQGEHAGEPDTVFPSSDALMAACSFPAAESNQRRTSDQDGRQLDGKTATGPETSQEAGPSVAGPGVAKAWEMVRELQQTCKQLRACGQHHDGGESDETTSEDTGTSDSDAAAALVEHVELICNQLMGSGQGSYEREFKKTYVTSSSGRSQVATAQAAEPPPASDPGNDTFVDTRGNGVTQQVFTALSPNQMVSTIARLQRGSRRLPTHTGQPQGALQQAVLDVLASMQETLERAKEVFDMQEAPGSEARQVEESFKLAFDQLNQTKLDFNYEIEDEKPARAVPLVRSIISIAYTLVRLPCFPERKETVDGLHLAQLCIASDGNADLSQVLASLTQLSLSLVEMRCEMVRAEKRLKAVAGEQNRTLPTVRRRRSVFRKRGNKYE